MHPCVCCSLIWWPRYGDTQSVLHRGLDKEDVLHIYNGILLNHKKDETLPFATTWMDLENIMVNEISKSEKTENLMISLIMWDMKLKLIGTDR